MPPAFFEITYFSCIEIRALRFMSRIFNNNKVMNQIYKPVSGCREEAWSGSGEADLWTRMYFQLSWLHSTLPRLRHLAQTRVTSSPLPQIQAMIINQL